MERNKTHNQKEVIIYTAQNKGQMVTTPDNLVMILDPLTTHRPQDYDTPQSDSRGEFVYRLISDKGLTKKSSGTGFLSQIKPGNCAYIVKIPVELIDWDTPPTIYYEVVDLLVIQSAKKMTYTELTDQKRPQQFPATFNVSGLERTVRMTE